MTMSILADLVVFELEATNFQGLACEQEIARSRCYRPMTASAHWSRLMVCGSFRSRLAVSNWLTKREDVLTERTIRPLLAPAEFPRRTTLPLL
jgi:hypothetical protein